MDFMSILEKRILKMLLKIYDGFCGMMDFPDELFVSVKQPPDEGRETYTGWLNPPWKSQPTIAGGQSMFNFLATFCRPGTIRDAPHHHVCKLPNNRTSTSQFTYTELFSRM